MNIALRQGVSWTRMFLKLNNDVDSELIYSGKI